MNHVDTVASPSASDAAQGSVTQAERDQLVADVEAYCQEIRPIEEICYLEHEPNHAIGTFYRCVLN